MPVRLIASDLDGTLFGSDHQPGPRAVTAINAAREAGIHVTAATGRSWFRGAAMATATGARLHHFIGSNGGHRVDLATDRLEERLTFSEDDVRELRNLLTTEFGPVGFGYELADGLVWDERFSEISPINLEGRPRIANAPEPGALREIGKMFVIHPDLERVDLVNAVDPHVPTGTNVTTSGAVFVELTPPGADKGSALERLANGLGIDRSEVVAFGDNQNDLTMLRWAGRGVAMDNAIDLVKDAADEVTLTNDDDGVAVVIERILGL